MTLNGFASGVLIFYVFTCLDCAIISHPTLNKHAHNIIHKDDENNTTAIAEFPIDNHSKIIALRPKHSHTTLKHEFESTTQMKTPLKITVPLVHRHEKKLTSIKHPLPPSWHDIMPHESPRYNVVDHDKVHHEFLHHEGPILQRRLHHHFSVEELRQKRKELKEKLQAKHSKMAHIKQHGIHDQRGETLKMNIPTTPMLTDITKDHFVLGKHLITTTPSLEITTKTEYLLKMNNKYTSEQFKTNAMTSTSPPEDYISSKDDKFEGGTMEMENNVLGETKIPEELKLAAMNADLASQIYNMKQNSPTHISTTTFPLVGSAPRLRHILGEIEHETRTSEPTEASTTIRPKLITFLRQHRFHPPKKFVPTTTTETDETTTVMKEVDLMPKNIVGAMRHFPTSTDAISTTIQDDLVVTRKISGDNSNDFPILEMQKEQAPKIQTSSEVTTFEVTEEPQMYRNWRNHLKEAIKRKLHKLRQNDEVEIE